MSKNAVEHLVSNVGRIASIMENLKNAIKEIEADADVVLSALTDPKRGLEFFKSLILVILDRAKIEPIKHLVDLDAAPFCPDGWSVQEHRKGGQFEFDPNKIKFWLSESQKKGSHRGYDIREELKNQPVLNANLLDFLLKPENQYLIPEEWKGKYIFFWGTIYRNAVGILYVRYLYWAGYRWHWSYDWLGGDWRAYSPAAVFDK